MDWLVWDAHSGDSLFFLFSGHGGQTEDLNGDEDDGMDETILPVDWRKGSSKMFSTECSHCCLILSKQKPVKLLMTKSTIV
jgi:hypothetical protein